MTDRITMDDVNRIAKTNPEAASLALGMQLMADSRVHTDKIIDHLMEQKDEEIKLLYQQIEYLLPLARKWLAFQNLLKEPEVYE